MGLIDDLIAETESAPTKYPKVSQWLDGLAPGDRDEWLEALGYDQRRISHARLFAAMTASGYKGSLSAVAQFRRTYIHNYEPPEQ